MRLEIVLSVQILLIFASIVSFSSSGDVFTSMDQIKGLSRLETFLTQLLDTYVESQAFIPAVVEHFASEMKTITRFKANVGVEGYVNHPSNVFLLVRRYLKHWTELLRYLEKGDKTNLGTILKENEEIFPKPSDLLGCANALIRIQEVYNISAKDMADGHLTQEAQGPKLGADECFELGYVTHRNANFKQARGWLRETLARMTKDHGYKGVLDRLQVLEYLGWAEYQMGDVDKAIELTEEILKKDPENKKAKEALRGYLQQQRYRTTYKNNIQERLAADHKHKNDDIIAFEKLCRGEISGHHPSELLRCYYKTNHPLLTLKPAKIEVISVEPDIQILYEALTDSEIKDVIKRAKPKLQRAYVTDTASGEHVHADYRISRSAWLEDKDSVAVENLHKRLEALTGLLVDDQNSEYLQVVNYGVGGHYVPHKDFLTTTANPYLDDGRGDRLATVMFYLSDVTAGGATVFLEPEIVVKPKKGDAIFWYNLLKNGLPDDRTLHGACPIIVGSKWVANKWILEKGQFNRRPCSLNEED